MFKKSEKQKTEETIDVPEASFSNLVLMLATGVYTSLGIMPDPISKKTSMNLPIAKNTIDLLDILRKKTQGNLTKEEEGFLINILSDIKMKFASIKKKEG